MLSRAVRDPVVDGVKVRLTVQLPPAATLEPQLLVCENSPLLVPVIEKLVMDNAADPLFVKVTPTAGVAAPTACPAKVTVEAERLAAGTPCVRFEPPPPPQLAKPSIRIKLSESDASSWRSRHFIGNTSSLVVTLR
jgi:hypothetical protein